MTSPDVFISSLRSISSSGLDVDDFLTDEFGGTNFALVHAAHQGPRIVPIPRLICDYAHRSYDLRGGAGDHYGDQSASQLGDSPYVTNTGSSRVAAPLRKIEHILA